MSRNLAPKILQYPPYLKTGIYHPEWQIEPEGGRERFETELKPVKKKEIYVSKVVVGGADATYESMPGDRT